MPGRFSRRMDVEKTMQENGRVELRDVHEKIADALGSAGPLPEKIVVLDFGDEGALRVDATGPEAVVGVEAPSEEDIAPEDCRLTMRLADFVEIAKGRLDPQMAYLTGRLKIAGDMGAAMAFGALLR